MASSTMGVCPSCLWAACCHLLWHKNLLRIFLVSNGHCLNAAAACCCIDCQLLAAAQHHRLQLVVGTKPLSDPRYTNPLGPHPISFLLYLSQPAPAFRQALARTHSTAPDAILVYPPLQWHRPSGAPVIFPCRQCELNFVPLPARMTECCSDCCVIHPRCSVCFEWLPNLCSSANSCIIISSKICAVITAHSRPSKC